MNVAILVGCSNYDDHAIARLDYASADAEGLASTLTATCGIDPQWLWVLSSSTASPLRSNLIRCLSEPRRLNRAPVVDKLFLFFSGHGYRSLTNGRDYLLLQDAVFGSLEDTALEFSTLVSYLHGWHARRTILFLDVCRSEMRSGKSIDILATDQAEVRARELPGLATFWSCSQGQRSFESDSLKSGVFTHVLRAGLGHAGRCKTIAELDAYLRREVPIACKESRVPQQDPSCFIEPLSAKDTILVSIEAQRQWESLQPAGAEIRRTPVRSAPPDLAPSKPLYCGFDFGTSHSAVCLTNEKGETLFVPSANGRAFIPSVIAFTEEWDYLVGFQAVEYGKIDSARLVRNIKRRLGSATPITVGDRSFSPEFLASLIIRSLAQNFEEYLGEHIYKASVSAPANFTLPQCNALLKAFELAGVPVQRLVGEPSAAALIVEERLLHGLKDDVFFILDLGGGTFDVSVVEIGDGIWELKSSGGDRALGGLDYDEAIFRYIISRVQEEVGEVRYDFSETELSRIYSEAERAKIELGTQEQTAVIISGLETPSKGFIDARIPISRGMFRALTEGLNSRAEDCITDVIGRAGYSRRHINCVVLAGQGAKIFTVRELIERRFPGIHIEQRYQETAVALGMGIYSDVFKGRKKDMLLLDALPTEIGIRCAREVDFETERCHIEISSDPEENKLAAVLVPRDTTIPTKSTLVARLRKVGIQNSSIEFVEIGYRSSDQTLIGTVPISGLESEKRFALTADIDANRTIVVDIEGAGLGMRVQLNNFFTSVVTEKQSLPIVRIAEPGYEVAQIEGECVYPKPLHSGEHQPLISG